MRTRALFPALIAACLFSLPLAYAQDLFVTMDHTVLGGNPINDVYDDVHIGIDTSNNNFFDLKADITGGTINVDLNAYNNSMVTFDGAVVSGFSYTYETSSLVVAGGSINNGVAWDNSVLTVNGGNHTSLNAFDNSTVTLTNGTIDAYVYTAGSGNALIQGGIINSFIEADDTSTMNISGGSVNGRLITTGDATVDMSGGTIDERLDMHNRSIVTLTGGSINGNFFLNGASTLNMAGNGWNVTQSSIYSSFNGADKFKVRDYTVTGMLQDGTAFSKSFTAGASYLDDGTTLTFGGEASLIADDLYLISNTTVNDIYNGVYVGTNADNSINTSPSVVLDSGTDIGSLLTFNGSDTKVLAGDIGSLYAYDFSTVEMSGGVVELSLLTYDHAIVTVSGGDVFDYAQGFNQSRIVLNGGNLNNAIHLSDAASFEQNGGSVFGSSSVRDNSTAALKGGDFNGFLSAAGQSQVTIDGGSLFGALDLTEQSKAIILSGQLDQLIVENVAQVTIAGGTVSEIYGLGGDVTISGGNLSFIANLAYGTNESMVFHFLGSGFTFSNPVADTQFGLLGVLWNLTGVLADGTNLNVLYFDSGGNFAEPLFIVTGQGITVFGANAPEPGSFLLVAPVLIGVCCRRKRRHSFPPTP